ERVHRLMDCAVERTRVSECLMREMMSLEVVPNAFDVVQFGRIFGQPLDDEPMGAGGQCRQRELARVDRSIVLDQQHRLDGLSGLRAIQPVDLLEMGDEVAAALGRAGVQDELACDVIERTQHGDLLRLPRRWHTQVRPRLGPGPREIRVRQCLALVAVEQHDIAGLGLLLAQLQAQADPFDLGGTLASVQRVPRPPPAELFLCNALDSCERLMRTPSCCSISARSRQIVQLRRSATGASSNGAATRNAASLFTGAGPGATVAFSASAPSRIKSLRHSRTVSSRTPNASAMRGLVQPASVSNTARARSASPRSREPASAVSAARSSLVAESGDRPVIIGTCESMPQGNQLTKRWSSRQILLSRRG